MSEPEPNADLDRSDRNDKWRLTAGLLALALVIAIAWTMWAANTTSQNKATSEASQKYTLAQQVAAACALTTRTGDLGGLCQSAQQIVKEGPPGSPGLAGPPGATGPQGPLGPKGDQGIQGFTGMAGAAGSQGTFGKTGDQGVVGPSGERGTTGADGTPGATGPAGGTGPAGPAGADGLPGPIGATGPAGADGQTPTAMTCVENPAALGTFDCTATAWR